MNYGNFIVSYEGLKETQFFVVSLPENSPFLFDRKRIRCSGDYRNVVSAKLIAEEEFRENRDRYQTKDDLEILHQIMLKQELIRDINITGQKRKSVYNGFSECITNPRRKYHHFPDAEEFYKRLAKE